MVIIRKKERGIFMKILSTAEFKLLTRDAQKEYLTQNANEPGIESLQGIFDSSTDPTPKISSGASIFSNEIADSSSSTAGQTLTIDSYYADSRNKYIQVENVPKDSYLANIPKSNSNSGHPNPVSSNFLDGQDASSDNYLSLDEIAKGPYASYLGKKEKEIIAKGDGSKYGYSLGGLTQGNYKNYDGARPFDSVYGEIPEEESLYNEAYNKAYVSLGKKYKGTDPETIKKLAALEAQKALKAKKTEN